ncbi:hypothetical protein TCAL_06381, partial [Tigriopus californicus]|eukprot:TCALIF_06381-PA protein Name:"Protein of unknown function" AED:0.20 eAED:0.20 QI:8/1/0/1/1/0.5/2/0/212
MALPCVENPPRPEGYPNSTSGVVLSQDKGPVDEGDQVVYQCPGVKKFNGKNEWTASCRPSGQYEFDPPLLVWPECQCETDLARTQCPEATFTMTYARGSGISPGLDIVLNLTRFATDEPISSFIITILMDMVLQPLDVRSPNAGLILKDSKTVVLSPHEKSDLEQKVINIGIEYTFDAKEVPAWRHPCIAAMECNVEYKSEIGDKIWIIVGG